MLVFILLGAGDMPVAVASSVGNVTIDPSSGPVGTPVAVEIHEFLDTPQPYTLTATSTDPAQGGCATAQPIPGVGTVTVGSQGGFVNFTWPSAFASGQYWLCASPQSGSGPSAHSLLPYTVTSAGAATATASSGYNPDNGPLSAAVVAPSAGAPAGSTVTVVVSGWATPDNAPPTTIKLVSAADGNAATSIAFVVASSPAPGDFNLTVTLPATTQPGQYFIEIDGGARSLQTQNTFQVIAPVTATATGNPIGTQGHDTSSGSGGIPPIAIGAAVAALLLLAVAILIATVRGRRRGKAEAERARRDPRDRGDDYAARHLADGYGMRHQREEMRRR